MSTNKAPEELKDALSEKVTGGANILNNSNVDNDTGDKEYQDATQTLVDNLWSNFSQGYGEALDKIDKTANLLKEAIENMDK